MGNFVDPVDELINKQREALGQAPVEQESVSDINDIDVETVEFDDDEYGDNDLENAIAEEDAAEVAAREQREAEIRQNQEESNVKPFTPPNEKDMSYHAEAIGFQADKLEIVTGMVNQVVLKYALNSGGIPDFNEQGQPVKMHIMGELMDLYHRDGDVITPEFENLILSNWIMDDGTPARAQSSEEEENSAEVDIEKLADDVAEPEVKIPDPVVVTVNAMEDTPVTINLDSELLEDLTNTREVKVNVRRVSELEMTSSNVVINTQRTDIISPYDSGFNDVPLTLPMSAYRCVIRAITYLDFIQLAVPSSGNRSDQEIKEWSILYKHIKNISIGQFKDFDDFLKMTKISDKELMMWGLLVATADDEEVVPVTCGNKKCQHSHQVKYNPREIIHVAEERVPDHYKKTHEAAVGDDARKHCITVNSYVTRYQFPDSKIYVDICNPSAYDYINNVIPQITELAKRFGDGMESIDVNSPEYIEFDILCAIAMFVRSMSIIKGGTEYKFTEFDDIEHIMRTALSTRDSGVFMALIEKLKDEDSPIEFYLSDVTCPKCGRKDVRVPINNIATQMLFQISRRLRSTAISLIDPAQK